MEQWLQGLEEGGTWTCCSAGTKLQLYKKASWSALAAATKCYRLGGLNNNKILPTVMKSQKSKIMVLADSVSDETPFLAFKRCLFAMFSHESWQVITIITYVMLHTCEAFLQLVFNKHIIYIVTSLVAQMVKNPPAMRETWVRSLGWEDLLEKGMQPIPVFLPGKSPRSEEPDGLQSRLD